MAVKNKSQSDKAKELLTSLSAGKKPVAKAAKPGKPKMKMSREMENHFVRFVEAYALAKDVDARRDNEKAQLNKLCVDYWIEQLWALKNRPPTQILEFQNHFANFIVADKYTFNVPELKEVETLEDGFFRTFSELFAATGMDLEAAEEAANNVLGEMDLKPRPNVDIFRWLEGHYEGAGDNKVFVEATEEEKALGIKLVTILQCRSKNSFVPLNDEECGKIFEFKQYIGVNKGFLQRICNYVKSLEQLKAVFTVIKPIVWPGQIEFAKGATPQDQTKKKFIVAQDILGVTQGD
jgi:hypothetical protein